jgi:hypothetical protein
MHVAAGLRTEIEHPNYWTTNPAEGTAGGVLDEFVTTFVS